MKIKKPFRTGEDAAVDIVVAVIGVIVFLLTFYPFYYVLIVSLSEGIGAMAGSVYLFPSGFTLANYEFIVNSDVWRLAFGVSLLRTLLGTASGVLFTLLVAYGLTRSNLRFKSFYYGMIIVSMYFSGGMIPFYFVLKTVGLLNKFGVYIVPGLLNIFLLIISVTFLRNDVSMEIQESAFIDGANEWSVFWRIILPISTPLIATLALFTAVGHWGAWLDSAYYVRDEKLRTVTYRMIQALNQLQVNERDLNAARAANQLGRLPISPRAATMASIIISIAPIMAVYPFLQRYFIKGIALGALKG